MAHNVTVNIHLDDQDATVTVSRPLAAHPHLTLAGDVTIFFGFNDDVVEKNMHALRDAIQNLIHQTRAERARREELAAQVTRVVTSADVDLSEIGPHGADH